MSIRSALHVAPAVSTTAFPDHSFGLRLSMQDRILSPPGVDEPITQLRHTQASDLTQLLLLLFSRIRVCNMLIEPLFEAVSCPFREVATPSSSWPFVHRIIDWNTLRPRVRTWGRDAIIVSIRVTVVVRGGS